MRQLYFKTMRDEEFQLLPQLKEGCWIHIDEATPEDLTELSQTIGMDYTDLQDCLDRYEVPRIERIQNNVIIFSRYPSETESGLYTSTLTVILTQNYLVTISPNRNSLIHQFIVQKNKLSTLQKTKLLTGLLLRITQEFTLQIRKLRQNVLRQEKEMITVESEDITTLTKNEEVLNQYQATLVPLRHLLEDLTSGRLITMVEKDLDHLRDVLNAVKQSEDLCNISIKSIRSLRDSYQIIFTNNVSKTIKLLTALTILFSLPTMIATAYGMNVILPFASSPNAFYYIIGFIALVVFCAGMIFQRKRWI